MKYFKILQANNQQRIFDYKMKRIVRIVEFLGLILKAGCNIFQFFVLELGQKQELSFEVVNSEGKKQFLAQTLDFQCF